MRKNCRSKYSSPQACERVMGISLAYLDGEHIKVAQISPGYVTCLDLDEEMITKAPIVNIRSNLSQTQNWIDKKYLELQCNTFKADNTMMYCNLSNIFTYVYVKQRKKSLNSQAVYFDVHRQFIGPHYVARHTADI